MAVQNSRTLLRAFGGLNETYGCTEAEYSAGMNFSARNFPALSTRTPRRKLREVEHLNGMYHLNGLLTVCGEDLVYTPDEETGQTVTLTGAVQDSRKVLVGIGTKILIFPDKKAFDTAEGSIADLGALWSGKSVTFAPCDAEGKTYTVTEKGRTEPEKPGDGQLFLKVEDEAHPWSSESTLEVYSAASGNWSAVVLDYCKVTAAGIGKLFREWDSVTVRGAAGEEVGQWADLNGEHIVYGVEENAVRLKATPGGERFYGQLVHSGTTARWNSLDGAESVSVQWTEEPAVERRVPDLDFLTECDNRVWGCSSKENVIYASKLGDPTNWFSYRGIAADSYAVTVGSDGPFTGAATCMGYALFFKENALHKLYGSKPADFQLSSMRCRGVARNAGQSVCVLNETLYYLSADGVMAWDGSIPTKVSTALDAGKLANVTRAVGGALDGRYYLHLERADGARLLVYDTERGLWQEEDVCSYEMASTGGQLYLWDTQALWAADPSRERDWQDPAGTETSIPFELTTGEIGLDAAENVYLSRLTLRLEAARRTRLQVAVSYDGGAWEVLAERVLDGEKKSLDLAFAPRRFGTLRLHLQGEGQLTLRSLAKTMSTAKGKIIEEEAM